jgi:hypothetical protein
MADRTTATDNYFLLPPIALHSHSIPSSTPVPTTALLDLQKKVKQTEENINDYYVICQALSLIETKSSSSMVSSADNEPGISICK